MSEQGDIILTNMYLFMSTKNDIDIDENGSDRDPFETPHHRRCIPRDMEIQVRSIAAGRRRTSLVLRRFANREGRGADGPHTIIREGRCLPSRY